MSGSKDGWSEGLAAYADAREGFRVEDVAAALEGSLEDGINACIECCDRHVAPGRIALEWENEEGRRATYTFEQLRERSAQFAGFLTSRGIGAGDVVAGLLPRTPELVITILGTWRAGAVYQPLFTAFGPKAIEHRLRMSGAKLIVTDPRNRQKLDEVADAPAAAVVIRLDRNEPVRAGDADFHSELARQGKDFEPVMRRGTDLFMMMSTSGTTGLPKCVPVPLRALLAFYVYMRYAVDLRPSDKFWNIADPGWAYGLYYAVTGPLLLGHATTLYDGPFSAESTYRIIKDHEITNLAGAPTAYRLLIAAGEEAAAAVKGKLRAVSSAGEPLNPEVIRWFDEHLAAPIYDHYGQTELGMVVSNHHGLRHAVHPGSTGLPLLGHHVAVLDDEGRELPPNVPGTLALDIARSPFMWFTGYLNQPTPAIDGGYYRTGDTVELEADGHISFVGRNDDVITSSGYRIGPFDVESALIEHPAVVETAVIGKPDPERTEIVKAFVVLRAGVEPSDSLAEELCLHVKRRLSAHAYPREISFVETLPKTPSGKIQRFILRNNEKAQDSVKPPE
ncbi:acyl-CoA synthetase [Paraburkholderia domus]|uniref:acyl-CoA synthetase n=1 Tax=Paraburkholderia domus TaxID=2793075 RepID=UPI001912F5BB|nr:acyl-CoA synthetase [Paraburkholderia domus]MBK5066310.1 acyl-CoA synthetase [Burkholderia sp. R-70199]CAE6969318.1 Acetyl-coenzyme A synthetase [Paraburkholderia domus]